MAKIGVLGSLNVDLSVTMERFHRPGETIAGKEFHTFTGGKGGNQAVAVAKLGVPTIMAGKLGNDQNGQLYRETMRRLGIEDDAVATAEGLPSGIALIEVDAKGDNRIVVVSGANGAVDRDYVDKAYDALLTCDVVLLQLEIPLDTVVYAAERMHAAGKRVILDPAPAIPLPDALLAAVDYITPNETELGILTGMETSTREQVEAAARKLLEKGASCVVAKLGARGAMLVTDEKAVMIPGYRVAAIDTTAAGDSFNAGFAVALLECQCPTDAVRFANATAALSTTGMGAQAAMPSRAQVEALMQAQQVNE